MKRNPDSVGVRELRQNLSVYLRRVEAGEKLRVTDRGRIVAALVPLRENESFLDRLALLYRTKGTKTDPKSTNEFFVPLWVRSCCLLWFVLLLLGKALLQRSL